MGLFDWLVRRKSKSGSQRHHVGLRSASAPGAPGSNVASPGQTDDLRLPDWVHAQEYAASQGARVGDMNVGFRVIAVKDGALDHLSIVLAENVSATVSAKYVVWTLDRRPGGGYKSGRYLSDRAEAQKIFESRER